MKGISAVIATILMLVITIAVAGLAYTYISGIFAGRTRTISLIDSWCSDGTGMAIIRNDGVDTIRAGEISVVKTTSAGACDNELDDADFNVDIAGGAQRRGEFSGCPAGAHAWRIVGPSNVVVVNVIC